MADLDTDGRPSPAIGNDEMAGDLMTPRAHPHFVNIGFSGTAFDGDSYGALLMARFADRTLFRHCHTDCSYLSSSDPRVHFGLGTAARVDTLTIRWLDGRQYVLRDLPADRYLTVREGKGIVLL